MDSEIAQLKEAENRRIETNANGSYSAEKGCDVERSDGSWLEVKDLCHPIHSGLSYVFSGDTSPCEALTSLSQGASLLYHEATFAESLSAKAKQTGHSTAAQAASTAKEAGVKALLLGHFSSRYRSPNILLDEAKRVFEDTELAVEGKSYALRAPFGVKGDFVI